MYEKTSSLGPALKALQHLRTANAALAGALAGAGARVFKVPEPHDEENSNVTSRPPSALDGKPALRAALELLGKTHRERDQDPHLTYRLPGLVWTSDVRVLAAAAEVNACKQALENDITGLNLHHKYRPAAFEGTDLENVHLVQCYRRVQVITDYERRKRDAPASFVPGLDPVRQVSFGWGRNLNVVKQMSIADAIAWLREGKGDDADSRWIRKLQALRERGDKFVARVRPVPAHPIANIKRASDWAERLGAPSPLVFVGDGVPVIEDLRPCPPPEKSVRPREKLEDKPLMDLPAKPRLYAYLAGFGS